MPTKPIIPKTSPSGNRGWLTILAIAMLAFSLGGCFEFDQQIYINTDGSGRSTMKYIFPLQMVQGNMPGVKLLSDKPVPMSQEEVEKLFKLRPGITLKGATMQDSDKYRMIKLDLEFKNIADLSEQGLQYEMTTEGARNVVRIRIGKDQKFALAQQPTEMQKQMAKSIPGKGMTFQIFLPRKIEDSNADKAEANTATWNLPMSFLMDPDRTTRTLEVRFPATRMERAKFWLKSFFQ